MPDSNSFSNGVDKLLLQIRPYGRRESCFPENLDDADSRRRQNESLQHWFRRVVDRFCDNDPTRVALEENLAIFARFGWTGSARLEYANIQTVYALCGLEEYYVGSGAEAIYLRLDFDYKTLGDPFSHPLAHIHVEGDLSPRFALDGGNSGNIILDYLEFLSLLSGYMSNSVNWLWLVNISFGSFLC